MALAPGTKLGPYEIVAPIGAGGMGEVYRARDSRLDRTVAIKILPAHLSGNADLRARFEREARAVSSLNHPNICVLHDVGNEGGVEFLVMEYLEGESLADRLERGPLPVEQVLRYGVEIADALDRAHRQGMVHRDLKPGNVMLTKSGAKLLDFGLAKLQSERPLAPGGSATAMPTKGHPLTAEGTILGTIQYMAPEQLEGREADARTDVFALGVLLYEMATGKKAFEGKSQASLIASILRAEPPSMSAIEPMSPPALDWIARTCMAKDPDERWQTAHDVKLQLRRISEASGQAAAVVGVTPAASRAGGARRGWIVAALLGLATATLAAALILRPEPEKRLIRSSIESPAGTRFNFVGFGGGPAAISPDGRHLAFTARDEKGLRLWIHTLADVAARPIPATDGATYPFWSPDSRYVAFFAGGRLKKAALSGGPPISVCDASDGRGGTWNRDGVILFTPHWSRQPVHSVKASGGNPVPVTALDESRNETTHRWPYFLPDGRHFLFLAGSHAVAQSSEAHVIYLSSLDGESRILVHARSNPVYSQGHLLYEREGTLMAQPFDLGRLELSGEPLPVADGVQYDAAYFRGTFSASENGVLVYQPAVAGAGSSRIVRVDREGRPIDELAEPDQYLNPRLSHDGRRLMVVIGDPGNLWSHDLTRNVVTRITFNTGQDYASIWSPDDTRIVFGSFQKAMGDQNGMGDLFMKSLSGSGEVRSIISSDSLKVPTDWSPDGGTILYGVQGKDTGMDIWSHSVESGESTPILESPFSESGAHFSPDGRYFVYSSDEAERDQIYVRSLDGTGGKWQISADGGSWPTWSRDGSEIFYLTAADQIAAVPVRTTPAFEAGNPEVLFRARLKLSVLREYDVAADGQSFVINRMAVDDSMIPISLVQNWLLTLDH